MTLPAEIRTYLQQLGGHEPLEGLISEALLAGDKLFDLRRQHNDIHALIAAAKSDDSIPFKLKHKVGEAPKSPIRYSSLRDKLGVPESNHADVLSRDSIKIKGLKDFEHKVTFDAAANFKDGNHNWGVHASIENAQGQITHGVIYMPSIGQIYFADENGAHIISFPTFRSADQNIRIERIAIGPLSPKFNCEVGSWHTKERALVKTLFTMLLREEVGGSLRETGMKEAPFAWVALNRLGYAFIGNLKPEDGRVGAFIAAKGGANVLRIPLTSDSQGRSIVLAAHPALEEDILAYFNRALTVANDDVTIGAPAVINRNSDRALLVR